MHSDNDRKPWIRGPTINLADNKVLPIYRIENGELVRVENDVHISNKQYRKVVKRDKQYLVEYVNKDPFLTARTVDEYLRRNGINENPQSKYVLKDAGEGNFIARWDYDLPKPTPEELEQIDKEIPTEQELQEVEQKRQELEFKEFKEGLVYEDRIVAFLDILAWKSAICLSESDPEKAKDLGVLLNGLQTAERLNEFMRGTECGPLSDARCTHFSDSVVISVLNDKHGEHSLLHALKSVVTNALSSGFFIRGGITKGKLIHKDNLVYGPALIEAYNLENKIAKYPRIILDHSLSNIWIKPQPVQDTKGNFLGYAACEWKKDPADSYYFYDLLQPFERNIEFEPMNVKKATLFGSTYSRLKEVIETHLNHPDHKVRKKYEWLAKYYNAIAAEYANAGIIPIN